MTTISRLHNNQRFKFANGKKEYIFIHRTPWGEFRYMDAQTGAIYLTDKNAQVFTIKNTHYRY